MNSGDHEREGFQNRSLSIMEEDSVLTADQTHASNVVREKSRIEYKFMDEDSLGEQLPDSDSLLVRFNVSGVSFLLSYGTLRRDDDVFARVVKDGVWIASTREYFFERDPVVFRFVHNYLRNRELHLPLEMCGPLLEKELDAWNIPLGQDVRRCRLGSAIDSRWRLESLEAFECKLYPKPVEPVPWIKWQRWNDVRTFVWRVIDVSTKRLSVDEMFDDDKKAKISAATSQQTDCWNSSLELIPPASLPPTSPQNQVVMREPNNQPLTQLSSGGAPNHSGSPSESATQDPKLRMLRSIYLGYETVIIVATVITFILSTDTNLQSTLYRHPNTSLVSSRGGALNQSELVNQTSNKHPCMSLVIGDWIFSILFAGDACARMVFCPSLIPWLLSPTTLIDIVSLVPLLFDLVIYSIVHFRLGTMDQQTLSDLLKVTSWVDVLKVFIVLRLFRLLRRHRNTRVLMYTIRTSVNHMASIIVLILVSSLFFGSAIHYADDGYASVLSGSWWALVTMSTVGYGDLVPKSAFGYLVSTCCIVIGLLLMSYTIPILVNHFFCCYDHADQLNQAKHLHCSCKTQVCKSRQQRIAKMPNRVSVT